MSEYETKAEDSPLKSDVYFVMQLDKRKGQLPHCHTLSATCQAACEQASMR